MTSLAILTGAGMSADSGLSTFRDAGGLWEGYDVEEVASISGWHQNPKKVLDFYNLRRAHAAEAEPNAGHRALVDLESCYEVTIITQNVDDLHERAGSTNVLHLHGELSKARSVDCPDQVYSIGSAPIFIGDLAEDGAQLRPHIVWFGEGVPMIEKAAGIVARTDALIVIGTSLSVYPAAGLVDFTSDVPVFVVDSGAPDVTDDQWIHYRESAAVGTPKLVQHLVNRKEQLRKEKQSG
ncbi:MAG: Sir2 family NAD-dependent protein deacetylase [Balneolaceae bacterium]